MTVGIPLFDQNGVLKYAVCFNTVSMEQINTIQQNYRHLQDSLQQYTQEIAELRLRATATDLVVKSPAMQRLWTLILNTANTKANILITGRPAWAKQQWPRPSTPSATGQRPLYRGQLRGAP